MAKKPGSDYEWRRRRGRLNRLIEKVESLPADALSRKAALSPARKRAIYERGLVGSATILKAPPETMVTSYGGQGPYHVQIQLADRDPYELRTWQDFMRSDWEYMQPGIVVEVRVDPEDPERVLLCPPENAHPDRPAQETARFMDSSAILAEGMRAPALVLHSDPMGVKAPGSEDEVHALLMELRPEGEEPWRVRIAMRVPAGAEALAAEGETLRVAYRERDDGESVAVDWSESSGGRFS